MTADRPVFTVTCSPGRDATVSVRRIGPGWLSLVLSMDPGRVVVDVPGVRGGAEVLARFCRQLAHEAAHLAATLEPGGQPPIGHPGSGAQQTATSDRNQGGEQ